MTPDAFPGTWKLFVPGIPRPGGSKVPIRIGNHLGVREAGKHTAEWRSRVALAASQAWPWPPLTCAVDLTITFRMPRPKGHYRTGRHAGALKPNAPRYPTGILDATKLRRSTEDALAGIVFRNDSQVCDGPPRKRYADDEHPPGAYIAVTAME